MTAAPDTITGCSTARRSTTTRTPSFQTNAGAREARRVDTARFATALHHCAIIVATGNFETDDAERWGKLPEGMTHEQRKAGGSGKKAVETIARQGRDPESALVSQARKTIEKIRASVREYIDAQRVFGLTAPGFSPRRRSTVQLPKAEYASVMSAINESYKARFEGKVKGRIAVGNYSYSFEISGFNEYRITGRRYLK